MASQSITPVASTSTAPDNAIINIKSESTEKQRINIKRQKDEINYNLVTWWLRMVEPRRAPYFPQEKDKIVYLRQAHEYYLKEVTDRNIFHVEESDKLWVQMNIVDYEYLTVINVSFERYPTRIACLTVRKCINKIEDENKDDFELKYHDMEGVVDFLVLKHIFDEGLVKKWNVGDPFRYLIDNMWYSGIIVSIKPQYQRSPFQSFQIKWDDDGELDQISPWEIQRINENRLPENHGDPVEVDPTEIEKMRYEPCPDDWPNWKDCKATIRNIISEFNLLMDLPISKCFIEIKKDPIYDALVSYPVDLSTIKQRIQNHFYRRIDTLLLDISYLMCNAKEHKSEKFFKEAELIAQACCDILYTGEANQVKLSENILSIESDDDNEHKIFGSSNEKEGELSYKDDWNIGCSLLLNILGVSEDMYPFRQPVSYEDYPNYYKVISTPICFEEIITKFYSNLYKSQKEVFEDIELIISNSYKFNQVEESAIYCATEAVEALFKELRRQLNIKKESSRKNKSLSSRKEKQKNSNRKSNDDTVVCKKDKEIYGSVAKIETQQMDSTNQKSSNQDENIPDETEKHSKNNNDTKDLSKALSANGNVTNLAVQTSNFTVTKQNKGNENKCNEKENLQKQDSMKRKQLQFINEHNTNESPKKKLHTFTVENNAKKLLLYDTHFVNSNEEDTIEVVEDNNKTNNSNNSEFDNNNDCEIIGNNCTDLFNDEPKSLQILLSQIEDSLDSFNLQVSDEEHGHQEAPTSCKKEEDITLFTNRSSENGDKGVNKSLQNNYNEDLSKASSVNGNDKNLAVQTSNLAIRQTKEKEIIVVRKMIFKEEDSMKQEVVQSMNEETSNGSPKGNVDNDDCEIIENDCRNQINNEPKSSRISKLQRTDSTVSVIVIDSDIDDDEEYGKVSFAKTDDPTHSQTHYSTVNTDKDVNKCLLKQSNFKSPLASIKANSMNMNVDEEKRQEVTKSCIQIEDFTQSQAHCTESTNQFHVKAEPSYILQSQIGISTESFDLKDIKEEQEHQEPSQSCSNVELVRLQNNSLENWDKDVNDSSQEKSNITKSLASFKANSIIMNGDEEKRQEVAKSCIQTEDFTQSQAHCTESTNQFHVKAEPSYILQSQIGISTESFDLKDIKEEQEHQEPSMSCNKVDLPETQNHSTENRDKDVNDSFRENSNVKKSASINARKRMKLKYNRIFQRRPHKSCDLCQCIKRTYLAHLKSHHTFNTS